MGDSREGVEEARLHCLEGGQLRVDRVSGGMVRGGGGAVMSTGMKDHLVGIAGIPFSAADGLSCADVELQ